MAWLIGWSYRKPITISNTATDYQTKITVYYGSGTDGDNYVYCNLHCQVDFDDIRFTKSDGNTLLPYWVESKVDSDYAIIWVKNDNTPQTTGYIYYGNSGANSASNGDDTFILFDDFNGDFSKWDKNELRGTVAISGGLLTMYARTSGTWGGCGVTSKNTVPDTAVIEALVKRVQSYNAGEPGLIVGLTDKATQETTYYGYWNQRADASLYSYTSNGRRLLSKYHGAESFGSSSLEAYENKWVRITAKIVAADKKTYSRFVYGSTDTTINSPASSNMLSNTYVQIHYAEAGLLNYSYCDWVAVCKYASTEPTFTFGAEQTTYQRTVGLIIG